MSPDEGARPPENGGSEASETLPGGLADPRAPWEELIEDPLAPRRLLAVMFTDIVGSTELASTLGDKRWRELLEQHDAAIRAQIARFGGTEVDTAGDAFFATFELPVRAVDCALASVLAVRKLGLRIRAGVHMGECVVSDGRVRGVTVHIGARVGAKATGGQVLVSSTVRDLLAGAGIKFSERGIQTLKGVEGRWRLYEAHPRAVDKEEDLPPLLEAEIAKPPLPWWQRRRTVVAAGTAFAVVVAATAYFIVRGPGGLSSVAADSVATIDASSGAVTSEKKVRRRPVGLTVASDGVWVANSIDRSVTRVGENGETETIPVGAGPIAVASGQNFIWVANGDGQTLSKISPSTGGEVGERIPTGNGLASVAFGANAVWIANSVDGTVWRIDPSSGRKTMEVQVGPSPRGLTVTNDAVWVAGERGGTVSRIDPVNGTIVRVYRVGNGPADVAVGAGGVWVVNVADGTVSKVDPASGNVSEYRVGRSPRAVAVAGGHVFVANEEDESISMLDARTGALVRTINLDNSPMDLAASGDRVWVTVRGGNLRYRGGTLRVGSLFSPTSLDPTAVNDPSFFFLYPAVYDGLTAFKRVGGTEGNELVPNLAEEIRPPTDNGTTYTFTLRRGLRYSDGTPILASDVRATFEKALRTEGYGAALITIIKGAEGCKPQACDLSQGIVTDDRARTIVFHLSKPLADFPNHLAVPALGIVSAKNPPGDAGLTPVPGTGPYHYTTIKIDAKTGGTITLQRNPHFRARGLAQPDGYADRIEVNVGGTLEEHVTLIKAGREDVILELFQSPSLMKELASELPAQLHIYDVPWTAFLALNSRRAPFNDARARRALNYAIDRRALTRAGATTSEPSCQVLPKNTVGYVPYCPYTRNPNQLGVWSGPDLATAKRLVAESRTAGRRVVITIQEGEGFAAVQRRAVAPVIAQALRAIGYVPQIVTLPGEFFPQILEPGVNFDVTPMGWISDFPAASNFVLPLLTCPDTLDRLTLANYFAANVSGFCDKKIDAKTERALALQREDPSAARDAWAEVDRALTDSAAIVSTSSLRSPVLVSRRVGNVQGHAAYVVLLSQMWVIEEPKPSPS